jgi:hypothetical protein
MIQIARDAPGSTACGRSGLPLLAICPNGHRRTVPFRLLKTSEIDRTPIYGRPFKCRVCDSAEVTLFAIESQAELDEIQHAMAGPPRHRPPIGRPIYRLVSSRALQADQPPHGASRSDVRPRDRPPPLRMWSHTHTARQATIPITQ